ncbi:hypothetical protein [Ferribacterium limneticum]|uniref:hypothetical protein n=1 Tax=Ferribacterium limneticum TaxID=76259 RepID=UPI001CF920DD|nr:hypothetical protein [Ferribacterium limneticum]UCV26778.1 hypothetical protein KI617_10695 [Ferribacterium limneticum]UCV30695.1 hypothetical protein KI608_10695 [Ferribacterium limneticum]
MNNSAVSPVIVAAAFLVESCVVAAAARIEADGRKGAALTAAHAVLDAGNTYQAVHDAAAAARETAGGKTAPKHIQAGYKLAKRFATIAEFCEKQGLTFKDVGATVGEKKTFSLNMAEKATRTDSDNEGVKAFAVAFQAAKGQSLIARVCAAEEAEKLAVTAANNASLESARAKMRAAILAELEAEQAAKQADAAKPAKRAKVA